MRFLQLRLIAFGPFTDYELDLSGGEEGLHIVYGRNEAGKSSSLRAITNFLYGFESSTADGFIHPYQKLRVGARIQHSDGSELNCIRRKAIKNSLRDENDVESVDDKLIKKMLGDIDRDLFRSMLGINHDALRAGGQEIVRGQGKIGEMLFSAGAGIVNLTSVQSQLQTQQDHLLKPSGRSGSIFEKLKSYQETKQKQKETQVNVESWKQAQRQQAEAASKKERIDSELRQRSISQNKLTRIKESISLVAKRKRYLAELEPLQLIPILGNDFASRSEKALAAKANAEHSLKQNLESLEQTRTELESTCVPESILLLGDTIEHLKERWGAVRKSTADLVKLENTKSALDREIDEILKSLGRINDRDAIESLRVASHEIIRIQTLAQQYHRIQAETASTDQSAKNLSRLIQDDEERLKLFGAVLDCSCLEEQIEKVQLAGDLERQLETFLTEKQKIETRVSMNLGRLPNWSGTLEELQRIVVPTESTIDRFSHAIEQAEVKQSNIRAQIRSEEAKRDLAIRKLRELEISNPIPTIEDLTDARRLRENSFQSIEKRLLENTPVPVSQTKTEDLPLFAHTSSKRDSESEIELPESILLTRYRESVLHADRIADILRDDADRVATKQKYSVDLEELNASLSEQEKMLTKATDEGIEIHNQWKQLLDWNHGQSLTPNELKEWRRLYQEIIEDSCKIRDQEIAIEGVKRQIIDLKSALTKELEAIQSNSLSESETLRESLRIAIRACKQLQENRGNRIQIETSLLRNREALIQAHENQNRATAELTQWKLGWKEQMHKLGLDENALPEQATCVLNELANLFQKTEELKSIDAKIKAIDVDQVTFRNELRHVTKNAGNTFENLSDEAAIGLLYETLKVGRVSKDRFEMLDKRKRSLEESIALATAESKRSDVDLSELCKKAGCESFEQLTSIARKSTQRQQLEASYRDLEDEILLKSGGLELDDYIAEVEEASIEIDSIEIRLKEWQSEIEKLQSERDEIIRELDRLELTLQKMNAQAESIVFANQSEGLLASIEEEVREFAVLKISSAILAAGIENHRKKNQGPILERANELFRRISNNHFTGLRVDLDQNGVPILLGIREASCDPVPLQGMSDGTCDQLYLALRLASLETWLDHHERMPFIVDDVLLNFDDERSTATLRVLAELSKRTQVIFFTHHQHLVDLAKSAVSEEQLFVHQLVR